MLKEGSFTAEVTSQDIRTQLSCAVGKKMALGVLWHILGKGTHNWEGCRTKYFLVSHASCGTL